MIRGIFFDIDGTLLSHHLKKVPESSRRALELLRERGIHVFMASGRHLLEVEKLPARDLVFDGYVTLNGQLCLNEKKEVLFSNPIQQQDQIRLGKWFAKKEVPLLFVEENRVYINYITDLVKETQQDISTPLPSIDLYQGDLLYQVSAYLRPGLEEEILANLPHCHITRWNTKAIDIVPASGGKQAGIQAMLKHYKLTPDEIMAFGDGENDMGMLQLAKIGVAMGNAPEQVRKVADFTTKSCEEDGIMHALRHFHIV